MANMPAGGTFMGFVYFAAAKYAGYTAFCKWFIGSQLEDLSGQRNDESPAGSSTSSENPPLPSFWIAGGARTLIGVAIGTFVGLGFWNIPYFANRSIIAEPLFFVGLVPVRILEWWLLLAWIYKAFPVPPKRVALIIAVGILVSFALDVVGIISAFVIPGGVWVC
jgi:hypothetical protein